MKRLLAAAHRAYLALERWTARKQLDPDDILDRFTLEQMEGSVWVSDEREGT